MSGSFSFQFRVTLTGEEPVEVSAGPAEIVRLERHFGVGIGSVADAATMRFEWLCFLAWAAQQRTLIGTNNGKGFDEWLGVLADLEIEGDDEETDPTTPATTPAASPV